MHTIASPISNYRTVEPISVAVRQLPAQQQYVAAMTSKQTDIATISSEALQLSNKVQTAEQYDLTNMSPNGIRHLAQQLHESGDISAIQMGSMVLPLSVQERLGYVQEKINYLENQRSYNEFISHSGSEIEKELQADLLSKLELLHSQRKL